MAGLPKLADLANRLNLMGRRRYCCVCNKNFFKFLPLGGGKRNARILAPVTQALEVIGSDRDNFWCPSCRCHDRTRHLVLYFDALDLWSLVADRDVLHFAPEGHLARMIIERKPRRYVQADLDPDSFRNKSVVAVDVMQMDFEDDSFDLVICNHVLEHLPRPLDALREISRVLKKGTGAAVLQTPYSPLLSRSFHDPGVTAPDLRKRLFGQEDHLRVFGTDLFAMIEEAGMELDLQSHDNCLDRFDPAHYGVNPRESLILGRSRLPSSIANR
jgi:SAM-dependent methyltransferase